MQHVAPRSMDGAPVQLAIAFDQINVTLRDDGPVNVPNMNACLHAAQRLVAEAVGFLWDKHSPNIGDDLTFHRYFDGLDIPSRKIASRLKQQHARED